MVRSTQQLMEKLDDLLSMAQARKTIVISTENFEDLLSQNIVIKDVYGDYFYRGIHPVVIDGGDPAVQKTGYALLPLADGA